MAKFLIKRKKSFPVHKNNPYRTRDIVIVGKLVKRNKIEIKVQQIDWTLKTKVDDKAAIYIVDSEYDYVSLVKMLNKELKDTNELTRLIEDWLDKNKYQYCLDESSSKQ
ncbi:hypothetical protein HYG86_17955 [Alkalicella caledoniensis]|uniref:Uncharacterized protein n=1 Tax=Alkalicella caledoniensis TaxID=2731377 RepID=A0A7G9WCW0_ALKCA|nr:hypothetical protein [Alkalicella caledoniensis]QNO16522.1 hypothetical protein HYG86_17955 [Alkalicella caledoniensis]